MSRTGKSRVFGSSSKIYLQDETDTLCPIGEIDKFSAKEAGELKKTRPLGKKEFASQWDAQGWELSFDGGKVDWRLASLIQAQNAQFLGGGRTPYFTVVQTVQFYDGQVEQYQYNDVTIHGYNFDDGGSGEEITEKFEGFASSRSPLAGSVADTGTTEAYVAVRNSIGKMLFQQLGGKPLADATVTPLGIIDTSNS